MHFALFLYLCITVIFLKLDIDDKHIYGFIDLCSAPNLTMIDNVWRDYCDYFKIKYIFTVLVLFIAGKYVQADTIFN